MQPTAPPADQRPGYLTRRLVEAAAEPLPTDARSIVFQDTVLCHTVMPYRDPGSRIRAWSRRQGGVCLEIEAGKAFDRRAGGFVELGLPYGPKPRLIFYYLNTEALRTKSPEIEVSSSLTAFTKRIGLSGSGRDVRMMKEQLARFYLGIANANGTDTTIKARATSSRASISGSRRMSASACCGLSSTLAIFGSGMDPEVRFGSDVVEGLVERHGGGAEGA
jgi:Plasmid encoded RepA protein